MNLPTTPLVPTTIKTLAVLTASATSDGTPILRGRLPRDLTTTDRHGHQRTYPAGCELLLRKNHGSYSLLAIVPKGEPLSDEAADRAVDDACSPDGVGEGIDVPF